jgi:glycosyltransferase involved in cell wall biosynthesis
VVVAIPALNAEGTIARVVIRSLSHADQVLVVDDGSNDDTRLIAEKLGAVVSRHEKNLGKGAALRDCFNWAKKTGAEVLVTLDADGQHDPAEIPKLVETLRNSQADVVIGSRLGRPIDMPRHRWFGGRALDYGTGVKVGDRFVDTQSGFRAYSRKAIETLIPAEYGIGVDTQLIMHADEAGMKIVETPITTSYAGPSTSSQNALMHWFEVIFGIVKFTSIRHPLLFYGGFSLVSFVVSLIFGFITLDYYHRYGTVVTNPALISIASAILAFLALFTGIILFTLITIIRETR